MVTGHDLSRGREEDDQTAPVCARRCWLSFRSTARLVSVDYSDDRNGGLTLSSNGSAAMETAARQRLGYPQSLPAAYGEFPLSRLDESSGRFASITALRESQSAEDYSGVGTSYVFLNSGQPGRHAGPGSSGHLHAGAGYASPKWKYVDFVPAYITSTRTATAIWSAARLPRRPVRL